MFKKLLFVSVIMASASNIALAATPYVGGSLGVTDLGVSSGKLNAGAIGKLFGGYGSTFGMNKNIYLGGELNIDLAHYPYNSGATYGLGASIIPGYLLTKDTMVYGRVGIETERHTKSTFTHTGAQLGLGLQTRLAKNWDIRGEYVRTTSWNNSQLNLGLVYKFD
jgi:opacity protein-like surface antigen